jgi:hypothetical protein
MGADTPAAGVERRPPCQGPHPPPGRLEQLRAPRDRQGEFVTKVFERSVLDDR